ncbi:pyridoxamine 5'-phosphate oxidase family protein, partial [Streptomyces hydrogenans]|uniref:pyridoxine/pyridoxamine 5'-phosphate oxidase n=1 Tax=Streptomyces hydrogenans TaxID=1873719 RepID=UPI0038230809
MREQYRTKELTAADLAPDPIGQFASWFKETAASPAIHEPNAMVVSTATPDGRPSSRTVLLKHYDDAGFVFFTNYGSRKGTELTANPQVALLFPWHPLARLGVRNLYADHEERYPKVPLAELTAAGPR